MQSRTEKVTFYHPFPETLQLKGYKYYDTPDGQDFLKKILYTTKLGLKFGYGVGIWYAIALRKKNASSLWLLYDTARCATPFVIASATYTVTTFCLTEYRKKDEVFNAGVGGAAAGAVIGAWFRKPMLAILLGIVGSFACAGKKFSVMEGVTFPHTNYQKKGFGSWGLRNLDFTLTENPPVKEVMA